MSIQGFNREDFLNTLYSVLHPSGPIDSIEFLCGRQQQLQDLEASLYAKGRHAFIIGDRGVGKSSLAHTAAHIMQSSDNSPIIVSCDCTSTLTTIVNSIISSAVSTSDNIEVTKKIAFKPPFLLFECSETINRKPELPSIVDTATATMALNNLTQWHSDKPIIVIDEFDQLPIDERASFGVLLKQLGDKGSQVKLIFTGIGQSLNNLLNGHQSSYRQIHQVKLEVLTWDARFKIIDTAFEAYRIHLPDDLRYKIAGLSDGFPHYIHLICEKILTLAYFSEDEISIISKELFIQALDEAIKSVIETIRRSYDLATDGKPEHIHHILWAMADSADLIRNSEHITHSYQGIAKQLNISPITEDKFKKEFAKLRQDSHGSIIKRAFEKRTGWFAFSENVLRGFIRMYAEQSGVTLDFDRNYTANTASVSASATRGTYQPLTEVELKASRLRKE